MVPASGRYPGSRLWAVFLDATPRGRRILGLMAGTWLLAMTLLVGGVLCWRLAVHPVPSPNGNLVWHELVETLQELLFYLF